jgi:N-acetylglucosamine-6-phosphate deacetylase
VAAPIEELCTTLAAISRCRAPNLLGAHLEGPFLNPERPRAMDPSLFIEPDLRQLERLLDAGDSRLRLMTLAPELEGAREVVKRLRLAGVVASLGHTSAAEEEIRHAVRAGASAATHLFNTMTPFHHRNPGPAGACSTSQSSAAS